MEPTAKIIQIDQILQTLDKLGNWKDNNNKSKSY